MTCQRIWAWVFGKDLVEFGCEGTRDSIEVVVASRFKSRLPTYPVKGSNHCSSKRVFENLFFSFLVLYKTWVSEFFLNVSVMPSFFIWAPKMQNRVLRPQKLGPFSSSFFFCLFLFSFCSFLLFLGFSFSDEIPIRVEDGQELSQSHLEMDVGLDQSFFHAKLGMGRGFPHTIGRKKLCSYPLTK